MANSEDSLVVFFYGGHGVNVQLKSYSDPAGVVWDMDHNAASYVLVHNDNKNYTDSKAFLVPLGASPDPFPFAIVSVNGIGEIRWRVDPCNREYGRVLALFGLRVQRVSPIGEVFVEFTSKESE